MTAAAKNEDTTKLYGPRYIAGPVNGGSILYVGAMWARNGEGNFVPAADTAGLSSPVGRGAVFVDGTGLSDGHANLANAKCEPGVYGFAATSALVSAGIAQLGKIVYVKDDLTVGLESDTVNGIAAGTLEEIRGTTFYVALNMFTPPGGELGGGSGAGFDTTVVNNAPGALNPEARYILLAVDGTDAYTLADGNRPGQRVTVFVTAGANTPVATITPATPIGYATVTALGALGDLVTFEWTSDGWAVVAANGVTFT